MRRLVQIVGVFLGLVIVCLTLLRAIQLENMLPLNSNDTGYINFQHATISTDQIDNALATIGTTTGLEIYQLSGTVGTREVTIISRGANQPIAPQPVQWFRPNKTGTIYPAADKPSASRSGIYTLKGTQTQRNQLQTWLQTIGAIHTWEHFTTVQTYFLPLAYQGVIVILAVTVFLVIATIFGWFITRAPSRIIRLTAGQTKSQIVYDDSKTLFSLVVTPTILTTTTGFICTRCTQGPIAIQLLPALTILCVIALLAIAITITGISYLTMPRIQQWVHRRSLISSFSWIATSMCALAIICTLIALPLTYHTYLQATNNQQAAQYASQLPAYYAVSFGGIVDETRDYDPIVQPFAQLVNTLDTTGQVALFQKIGITTLPTNALKEHGYNSLLILNTRAFNDLTHIHNGCKVTPIPRNTQTNALIQAIIDNTLIQTAVQPVLKPYTCTHNTSAIAIENQGIFSLATKPFIIVIPNLKETYSDDTITSLATTGSIIFHQPKPVLKTAEQFGLHLTTDNTSDTISVYTQDQYIGYFVSLASLLVLLLATALNVYTSAKIYSTTRLRATYPRYLAGTPIRTLIYPSMLLDTICIIIGTSATIGIFILLETQLPITLIIIYSLSVLTMNIIIRRHIMQQTLVAACKRKN